jgi:hypothetical protein
MSPITSIQITITNDPQLPNQKYFLENIPTILPSVGDYLNVYKAIYYKVINGNLTKFEAPIISLLITSRIFHHNPDGEWTVHLVGRMQ